MSDYAVLLDYSIKDGVFRGRVETDCNDAALSVILKNVRLDTQYTEVSCERSADGAGCVFEVRIDGNDFGAGTWYPVICADGIERMMKYRDMVNKKDVGRMTELSPEKVYYDKTKTHYMGALDKNSVFAIRKWKKRSKGIIRNPVQVTEYEVNGMNITFTCKKAFKRTIEQAEVWFICNSKKRVERVSINLSGCGMKEFDLDFSKFSSIINNEQGRVWQVYLVANIEGSYMFGRIEFGGKKKKSACINAGTDDSAKYVISTPVPGAGGEGVLQMYFDDLMRLSCKIVSREVMYKGMYRGEITDFNLKKGKLYIWLDFARNEFGNRRLMLRHYSEHTDEITEYVSTPADDSEGACYVFDYNDIKWESLRYEIILLADIDDYTYEFRVVSGGEKFCRKLAMMYKYSYTTREGGIVYLTQTIGGKLVLEYRMKNKYDSLRYRMNERIAMMLRPVVRRTRKNKSIIMLYEKFCRAAQDNAYYLFEYIMNQKDEKVEAYYVFEKNNREYKDLKKKFGRHIVSFMSIRHLIYIQIAGAFVSTDSKRHCYRWRSGNTGIMQRLNNKPFVFLQHGVLGFKRVENIYGSQFANKAELFVVSSEYEREIVERFFGYSKKNIIVTGLARWDKLVNRQQEIPMVFCMPTWRNWIYETDTEGFLESEYYKAYNELINSKEIADILEKNNLSMVFCLHPKFRQFSSELKCNSDRVKVVDFAECHINELLMRCSMFITDYSSASWDILYLGKPVLFYQFDADEYIEKQGAYIDIKKGLFGYRADNYEDFIGQFRHIVDSGFKECEKQNDIRERYLPVRDNNNRKRIYREIKKIL